MKITRRNFGKVIAGALTTAIMLFIPKIPELKANEDATVSTGTSSYFKYKTKKAFECKYFKPQIIIKEYKAGDPITYQNLSTVLCDMCSSQSNCIHKKWQTKIKRILNE